MLTIFSVLRRLLRSVSRFLSSLFASSGARISRRFRGPDILEVSPEGVIHVTRTSGPAPRRPLVVVNPDFANPRTQALARKAAVFLFDYFDFDAVPAQFWPVFEKSHDPGVALDEFLRAVGCNPDLVRRRDPTEEQRARDVIELLVRSGNLLHDLDPEIRRIVGEQLQSGDYARVMEVAGIVANLRAALDAAERFSGKSLLASFADLLRVLQRMLANPLRTTPMESARAAELIAKFSETQFHFDACQSNYVRVCTQLGEFWPKEWRGTSEHRALRDLVDQFDHVSGRMRSLPDLTWENLRDGLGLLQEHLRELSELLRRAMHFAGAAGTRASEGATAEHSPLEIALAFFGFTAAKPPESKRQLRDAWKKKSKVFHPDLHPGATEAELKHLREKWDECEAMYNHVLIHYGWHRPA